MCTTQRSSWLISRRCWRISLCLCLKSQSTLAVTPSCISSWNMWVSGCKTKLPRRNQRMVLFFYLISVLIFARWWVLTAWTTSQNRSTTFLISTVHYQPTGQKKTTHRTPTTSTTPTPTWLCSTTCEGSSSLFMSLPHTHIHTHLNDEGNVQEVLIVFSFHSGGEASTRLFCDLTVGRRGLYTTWCQVSCCQRTSPMGCCSERYGNRHTGNG